MKRTLYAFVIGLLLIGGNLLASTVDNVTLTYQDGATVARIAVDGQVRFIHQTEIPKDGKPYRVIVDVLGCVHNLSSKAYTDLPACPVTGIRSSQYAVQPEKIVRVVFDMAGSPLYNIASDDQGVVLTFTDNNTQPFAAWSGDGEAPQVEKPAANKTVAARNQAIEKDRSASLASQTPDVTNSAPSGASETNPANTDLPKITKAKNPDTIYQPEIDETEYSLINGDQPVESTPSKPVASSQQPQVKSEPDVVTKDTKEVPKPVQEKPKTVASKPEPSTTSETTPALKPTPKQQKPVTVAAVTETPAKQKSKPAAKQNAAEQTSVKTSHEKPEATKPAAVSKSAKSVPTAKSKQKQGTAAKADSDANSSSAVSSTSRFRRDPAKIQGTMVAEFPKRLVVKYRASSSRDPFASLVVEKSNYDGPIEGRVPNVEGMKLVGIIDSDGGTNRALLEDKQGYSYILKSGDKVQRGYVLRVESDRVYFQVFEYGWSRTIALQLEDY